MGLPTFTIHLKDLVDQDGPDRETLQKAAARLRGYYTRVLAAMKPAAFAKVASSIDPTAGGVDTTDLLVYVVNGSLFPTVAPQAQMSGNHAGGRTADLGGGKGVLSEVYWPTVKALAARPGATGPAKKLTPKDVQGIILANLVFHEGAHNKATAAAADEVHIESKAGGGVLAPGAMPAALRGDLSRPNVVFMAKLLQSAVNQFTDQL